MPLYDYKCPQCGGIKEVIHRISECDTPSENTIKDTQCTECGVAMRRQISNTYYATFASASPAEKHRILDKRADEYYKKHIQENKYELLKSGEQV